MPAKNSLICSGLRRLRSSIVRLILASKAIPGRSCIGCADVGAGGGSIWATTFSVFPLSVSTGGSPLSRIVLILVQGRHAREIRDEEVQQRVEKMVQGGALLRPGAAGAPLAAPSAVNLEALPPGYASYLKHAGITPTKLDEYLYKVGPQLYPGLSIEQAREAWFKEATAGDIVTEVTTKLPELRSA